MQYNHENIQILAPAGSIEQLTAAVNNGCDAVYLGLNSFNARMKAPNFTLDNLGEWVDFCHLFGVKVYVAINTSVKNDEFAAAVEMLRDVYLLNADGVIVTDLKLMRIAGRLPKPFDVVASTQLNIHDKFGAEFVKQRGATTVVCARECSYDDIKEIASVGIGVECFLHGAMCVCQSGQCLFSSLVGGNSGNRGLCAQPCRKLYSADGDNGKSGYLLSARDMCGLESVKKLVDCGATTFKIEGRNRRPEYAGLTSRIYRKIIDNNFSTGNSDYDTLAEMYNRSMTVNPYLNGDNGGVIYPLAQNHVGVTIGVIKNGAVNSTLPLYKGDGLKVFDGAAEVCGGVVLDNGKQGVRAKFDGKVCDGMRVNRTTSIQLCNDVLSMRRKLDVSLKFVACIGQHPKIEAVCGDARVEISGNILVSQALNSPTTVEEIRQQLQKTGDTYYNIIDIVSEIDEIFLPKSQINALRRDVLNKLSKKLVENYNKRFADRKLIEEAFLTIKTDAVAGFDSKPACAVICRDEQQLMLASSHVEYLVYKPDIIDAAAFEVAKKYGAYVDLPSFMNLHHIHALIDVVKVGIVCNNVGQVEFARQLRLDYIAGGGLNIFNDGMAEVFFDAQTFVYSRELTLREISRFENSHGLTFVDGEFPLMQLCHCPFKVAYESDCASCKSHLGLSYRDELNNRFMVRRRRADKCYFELMNGRKLSALNHIKTKGRFLIDYDESVLEHYLALNCGCNDGYAESKLYTKGRLYDKTN